MWNVTSGALLVMLGILIVIAVVITMLPRVLGYIKQQGPQLAMLGIILDRAKNPLKALLIVTFSRLLLNLVETRSDSWSSLLQHALSIVLIAAVVWFLCDVTIAVEEMMLSRYMAGEASNRRFRTQLSLLRRLLIAIFLVIGIASILMTFPSLSIIGQGVFASAGLLSIVAGLAAQTTLTNVFAGIQIALSNTLRVDDIVAVDGQTGRVDDVALTHVVIHLPDDRRLIYPSSHFISEPFENWTRSADPINGFVLIDVDWSAPFSDLRAELARFLEASPLWDGRTGSMSVADATGGRARLRIDLSAGNTSTLFALQAATREALINYVVLRAPNGIFRSRNESYSSAAPESDQAV